MNGEDDLRALLPDPPPPAPKQREAAIAGALARFDGVPAPVQKPRPATNPWWKGLQRPQAGLFAAAALVAAISLPFAWRTPVPLTPTTQERTPAPRESSEASAASHEIVRAPADAAAPEPAIADATVAPRSAPPPSRSDVAPAAQRVEIAQAAPAAPPPPPAKRAETAAPIVVQGRAVPRAMQDSPVAVTVVSTEDYSRDEGREVVVTGTRAAKIKPIGRGDWNACTVNDPARAPARCGKLAGKAPKAARSEAEAHLSSGLKQAWSGDLDKAIESFNAAIAVAPELPVAYLNRGLAYDRQGDSEAALADLDRTVRLSPKSARAYYNRSVLLRKYGDPKRASADEQQAINLDPRYQAILP